MRSGKTVLEQMANGIEKSDHFILMVSESSLQSGAVQLELNRSLQKRMTSNSDLIYPYILDDTPFEKLPEFLQGVYAYKFDEKGESARRLAEDIVFLTQDTID